jgi:hypothetical protein
MARPDYNKIGVGSGAAATRFAVEHYLQGDTVLLVKRIARNEQRGLTAGSDAVDSALPD